MAPWECDGMQILGPMQQDEDEQLHVIHARLIDLVLAP